MATIERDNEVIEIPPTLPVVPLRDLVVFPHMVIPLLVGRERSVAALDQAMSRDRLLFLVAQRDGEIAEPEEDDLYRLGTVARIVQMVRLPNGTSKALVEGLERAKIRKLVPGEPFIQVRHQILPCPDWPEAKGQRELEAEALARRALAIFEEYVKLNSRLPDEILSSLPNVGDRLRLAHSLASHILLTVEQKQGLLEAHRLTDLFSLLGEHLSSELEILRLEKKIEGEVKTQVLKNQKEYYLQEQLKAIHRELGSDVEGSEELDELRKQIEQKALPDEVRDKAMKELSKLSKMSALSPEATVSRNYIDWILSLPWTEKTKDQLDIERVARILDEDHHGLEELKERIVEYIAVLKLKGKMRGPILCFIGPPGVGKTSLAQSIARALGRKFVRISLGGTRDEAEIRGHRRTYIGSLPGRILQGMKKAATINPVFLLDEIDKLGVDFRGDPAAALLEVLDPEQNHTFVDHYLELEYDLSQAFFIATGNVTHTIPPALRDRMEILEMPGYLDQDKLAIAKGFLLPKLLEAHGLSRSQVSISDTALRCAITEYTREAGVRNLERMLAKVLRKVAKRVAEQKEDHKIRVSTRNLEEYLGPPKVHEEEPEGEDLVGLATGLAWTEAGGELIMVEVGIVPGKGRLKLTGQLGDIMKESGEAALSYVRSRAEYLGLPKDFYQHIDVHIHVPKGAIPKDGPSAGVTMCTAIASALTHIPARRDVAMTGELTLRGRVLPVGGLKEKAVAAVRAGIHTLILPKKNERELEELQDEIKKQLAVKLVESMDEALEIALKLPKDAKPFRHSKIGAVPAPAFAGTTQ